MSFIPVFAIASTRLFLLFSRIFKVDFASLYSKSEMQDLLYCSFNCFVITFILSSLKKNSTNLSITKLSRYSHLISFDSHFLLFFFYTASIYQICVVFVIADISVKFATTFTAMYKTCEQICIFCICITASSCFFDCICSVPQS